jgi:hypothetical protein
VVAAAAPNAALSTTWTDVSEDLVLEARRRTARRSKSGSGLLCCRGRPRQDCLVAPAAKLPTVTVQVTMHTKACPVSARGHR